MVARVLITTECNLTCSYCCNKIPEVKRRIKFITMDELISLNYSSYCISGGEPLLAYDKLFRLLCRLPRGASSYLYTNGLLLSEKRIDELSAYISGVNIGLHNLADEYVIAKYVKMFLNNDIIPRIFVEDTKINDLNMLNRYAKTWKRNECFNNIDTEDWLIC